MKLHLSTMAVWPAPPLPLSRVAWCVLAAVAGLPALAAEPDQVVRPYAGYAVAHDDNVLSGGAGDGVERAGDAVSSTSRRAEAGMFLDQRIGRQALSAALQFTHTTYKQLPELNHDGKDVRFHWDWQLGNHLDGNIGSGYLQALAPFIGRR